MVSALLQAGFEDLCDLCVVLKLPGRLPGMSEKDRELTENPGERSETVRQPSEAVWEIPKLPDKVATGESLST